MNAPSRPTEAQLAELYAWRSVALDLMPYMAAQLFALTPLNDPGVDTFAVDHRHRLYINFDNAIPYGPRFCGEALLHECSHLFGAHYDRANDAGITLEQYKSWGLCADFEMWAIHFTAISALSQSRRSAARQGRSWGGWARLLGRDRGPARAGGLIAFGRGLATSCR